MPVPSTIADLSTTAASNSPQGSESIGISIDDYIRTCFAFIKQLSDAPSSVDTSSFAPKTGAGTSGTWPINITGNATTATSAVNGGVTSVNGQTGAVTLASGVTSVNGSAGAISAAQVSAAATAGYGYTPANPANAATDHNHSGTYVPVNSYGVAGETTILYYNSGASIATGGTVAGSSLSRAKIGSGSGFTNTGVADTGTWKNLGEPVVAGLYGIFQRIA